MLAYLEAENAYADGVMAPLKPLQDRLYEEIVARIKQDDSSVPVRERGWWYYARFEKGQDYPVHARRRDGDRSEEHTSELQSLMLNSYAVFRLKKKINNNTIAAPS